MTLVFFFLLVLFAIAAAGIGLAYDSLQPLLVGALLLIVALALLILAALMGRRL